MHFLAHPVFEEYTLTFDGFELLGDLLLRILLVFELEVVLSFIRLDFFEIVFYSDFVEFDLVNFSCWEFEALC